MSNGQSITFSCPHCGKIQYFFTLQLPFSTIMQCGACNENFKLDARALASHWMNVLALWGALLGTAFFALGALVRFEWVALLMSPMLGIGVALLVYVVSIPIAHIMSQRIVANAGTERESGLLCIHSEVSTSWIEDILVMLNRSPPKRRSQGDTSGEAAIDGQRSPAVNQDADDPIIRDDDRDIDEILNEPSRSYVCRHCGGVTQVGGEEFARVTNPFTFVFQTYCASCDQHLALHEFTWENTGENLADFRKRMRRKTPPKVRLAGQVLTPLGGFIALYVLSLAMFRDWPWNVLFGLLGGWFAGAYAPPLVTQWMGVDYRKKR